MVIAKTTITMAQVLFLLIGFVLAWITLPAGSEVLRGLLWLLVVEIIAVGGLRGGPGAGPGGARRAPAQAFRGRPGHRERRGTRPCPAWLLHAAVASLRAIARLPLPRVDSLAAGDPGHPVGARSRRLDPDRHRDRGAGRGRPLRDVPRAGKPWPLRGRQRRGLCGPGFRRRRRAGVQLHPPGAAGGVDRDRPRGPRGDALDVRACRSARRARSSARA